MSVGQRSTGMESLSGTLRIPGVFPGTSKTNHQLADEPPRPTTRPSGGWGSADATPLGQQCRGRDPESHSEV